jgi:cyclopropane-fatty-acyl-phospholipid synthase
VPARFFELVLGPRMKYSSCWWNAQTANLAEAEEAMLEITAERAGIQNNQEILELGCGWGSLTLFLAEKFPLSQITAVSNSASQREFIVLRAKSRGLNNVRIVTADMNDFTLKEKFDRVVSVEMFEHMRNYRKLLQRISGFLKPDGRLFVHMFVHREFAYPFVVENATDWMAQHFFSGGIMPSADLLPQFTNDFTIEEIWKVNGTHYQKTAEAWLKNHQDHREEIEALFRATYGTQEGSKWWQRWRIFFLSCSELWGYQKGEEWFVSHYLMRGRER